MNFNDFGQFAMNNEQTENTVGGTYYSNCYYGGSSYNNYCGTSYNNNYCGTSYNNCYDTSYCDTSDNSSCWDSIFSSVSSLFSSFNCDTITQPTPAEPAPPVSVPVLSGGNEGA